MLKKGLLLPIFVMLSAVLPSCAFIGDKVLNPYESKYTCSRKDNQGRCMDVMTAYDESKKNPGSIPVKKTKIDANNSDGGEAANRINKGGLTHTDTNDTAGGDDSAYQNAILKKINESLNEAQSPLAIPPKQLRVLVLGYPVGDDFLYGERYIYMFVDKPRWIHLDPFQPKK